MIPIAYASGTILRDATLADIPIIDHLRKRDSQELGFIPWQSYEATILNPRESRDLLVITDNDDVTGFVYVSFAHVYHCKMIQICVREDARRFERAMHMTDYVEAKAARRGQQEVLARVAADIEAVFFWKAIGYVPIDIRIGTFLGHESIRQRELILFAKQIHAHESQSRLAMTMERTPVVYRPRVEVEAFVFDDDRSFT